jgi:hypothetical protein
VKAAIALASPKVMWEKLKDAAHFSHHRRVGAEIDPLC